MASAIGISGGAWAVIRRHVLERDDYLCQKCGRNMGLSGLEVHHIVPRSEGGTDDPQNLRTLCVPCHLKLHKVEKNPERRAWEERLGI